MIKIMAHMLLKCCGVSRSHRLQHQPLAPMRLQKQHRPYQPRKQPPWQHQKRPRALLQHESLQLMSKDFQHLLLEMISILLSSNLECTEHTFRYKISLNQKRLYSQPEKEAVDNFDVWFFAIITIFKDQGAVLRVAIFLTHQTAPSFLSAQPVFAMVEAVQQDCYTIKIKSIATGPKTFNVKTIKKNDKMRNDT